MDQEENKTYPLHCATKQDLYKVYMPFVRGGGLFIPTRDEYNLGDQVELELKLPDLPEVTNLPGEIVWYTPMGAQGGRRAGIGVKLTGDKACATRHKIETLLAGMASHGDATDTM